MWSNAGTHFVHIPSPSTPLVQGRTTSSGGSTSDSVDNGIISGSFLEYSGNKAQAGNWPNAHLVLAVPGGGGVAGVKTDSGVATRHAMAWVVMEKRKIPLSGIYSRTENGIAKGKTVVIVEGNSFIFAQTKDNDLEILKQKFTALTGN